MVKQIEGNLVSDVNAPTSFTVGRTGQFTNVYTDDGYALVNDSIEEPFVNRVSSWNSAALVDIPAGTALGGTYTDPRKNGGYFGGTPGESGSGTYIGDLWAPVGIRFASSSELCPIVLLDSHDALEQMAVGDFTDDSVYPEQVKAGYNGNTDFNVGEVVVDTTDDRTLSQGASGVSGAPSDRDMLTGAHASLNKEITDNVFDTTNNNPDIRKIGDGVGDTFPKITQGDGTEAPMGNVLVFEDGGSDARLGDGLIQDDTHQGAFVFDIDEAIATVAKLEKIIYVDDITPSPGIVLDVFFRDNTSSRYVASGLGGDNSVNELVLTPEDQAKNVDYFILENSGQSGGIGGIQFAEFSAVPEPSSSSLFLGLVVGCVVLCCRRS